MASSALAQEAATQCILSFLDARSLSLLRCTGSISADMIASDQVFNFVRSKLVSHAERRVQRLLHQEGRPVHVQLSADRSGDYNPLETLDEVESWDMMRRAAVEPAFSAMAVAAGISQDLSTLPPNPVICRVFKDLRQAEGISMHTFPHRSL